MHLFIVYSHSFGKCDNKHVCYCSQMTGKQYNIAVTLILQLINIVNHRSCPHKIKKGVLVEHPGSTNHQMGLSHWNVHV